MKQLLLMFKRTGAVCLLICTLFSFKAGAQQVITLQKAVDLTLERNLTIKQAQYSEALDKETLQQSKNAALPSLSASTNASLNFGRSLDQTTYQYVTSRIVTSNPSVSSQVLLFEGGQLRNQVVQNKILLDADKTYTAKVKNDLVLNVVTTFLQILVNQDLVLANTQQIEIAKITLDRTDKNFKVGNQSLADLSQAKAQLATAELNKVNADNQLEASLITLKQYMEMDPATDIRIERPDITKLSNSKPTYNNPLDIYNSAVKVNPDVLLAETRMQATAQGIKIAKGAYYPTLSMFGQLGSNFSDASSFFSAPKPFFPQLRDNFSQAVGVSLQIPIFTRFNTRTNVRKAQINYQNAELSAQLAKNNLSKIIYQAVWDLQASEKSYQSATQTYEANKEAFNVIQQRYTVGLVNSLDYNTSLTNLNTSQVNMIQAKYMVVFRSKVIDYYLGNPITL